MFSRKQSTEVAAKEFTTFGSAAGQIDNWRHKRYRKQVRTAMFTIGVNAALMALVFSYGAWLRRWIADDGLIVLRTVRNLLAGNGPVFNKGERVEVNTSTVWTYVQWFLAYVTHLRLEYIALWSALGCAAIAVACAVWASGTLWVWRGGVFTVPLGAAVYVALPAARDFATSGLEVSLVLLWLSVLWLLVVRWAIRKRLRRAVSVRFEALISFWAGLSVLVRPDLALVAISFLLALFITAPRFKQKVIITACAGFLPVSYEIFRMAYYGLLVPNTAIAKEASGSKWAQGWIYVKDLVEPTKVWIPAVLLLLVVLIWAVPFRHSSRRLAIREISPATIVVILIELGGILQCLFWIHQGGDFMHGRVLLPGIYTLLLPVMSVPITRNSGRYSILMLVNSGAILAGFVWVVWLCWTGSAAPTSLIPHKGIVNEREYYAINTGHEHPITIDDYADYMRMRQLRGSIGSHPEGGVYYVSPDYDNWIYSPFMPGYQPPPGDFKNTVYYLNLGMPGMLLPLDVRVIDQMGLAYPIAAHSDRLPDGRIGHDKNLLSDWVAAQYNSKPLRSMDPRWVYQAKLALSCPQTQLLIDSYSAELTFARLKQNIKNSYPLTKYRIDRIPRYSDQLCAIPIPPKAQTP